MSQKTEDNSFISEDLGLLLILLFLFLCISSSFVGPCHEPILFPKPSEN